MLFRSLIFGRMFVEGSFISGRCEVVDRALVSAGVFRVPFDGFALLEVGDRIVAFQDHAVRIQIQHRFFLRLSYYYLEPPLVREGRWQELAGWGRTKEGALERHSSRLRQPEQNREM